MRKGCVSAVVLRIVKSDERFVSVMLWRTTDLRSPTDSAVPDRFVNLRCLQQQRDRKLSDDASRQLTVQVVGSKLLNF